MAFLAAYEKLAEKADFVVVPDIVAGGKRSLDFSVKWLHRLRDAPCRLMLAVQDGMEVSDVFSLLSERVGIFVGGTTDWKLKSMMEWGEVARFVGAKMHVGRVNSAKRIHLCEAAGANSFDGSGPSRFAVVLGGLDVARQQRDLFSPTPAQEAAE